MDSVQNRASSSSSTVSASSELASHFVSQTEMEMESSKARHWSQLDYSTTDSEWSAESNFKEFALLKEDPEWGCFFKDFEALEVGEKISEGAQANVYEARNKSDGPYNLVVKVMKGDAPLKAFQAQWPIGMLSARSKYKRLFDLPLITILGGTVLRDQRLRGRFAFVMRRRWGDLRLLIDRRMKQERTTVGPFSIDEAIHLMLNIAEDMDTLNNKHDILHRDLKASNVLVWIGSGEAKGLSGSHHLSKRIGSVVADFECSVGVLGTRFWRAPEILEQLKNRVLGSEVQFTHASDVYSYGMTCYEIVTGCIPYNGFGDEDMIFHILQGRHPELPQELPEFVRNIIISCWHCDPSERLSFTTICMALKRKRGTNLVSIVIDNKSERGASIVKVEQCIWNIPRALTLIEVMQNLMNTDLSISKAFDSSSTKMITQYFEVKNCKGKKVVNDKFIANITKCNITKALSFRVLDGMEWTNENLETSIDENTSLQIHVVEVIAKRWSEDFLGVLSRLFIVRNFQVHSTGCWIRGGRVECAMYVEGARMGTLLWELQQNMKYFRISHGLFKIIVRRITVEDFYHLSRRLHNLKSMDLTLPRSSSNISVHQQKEFGEGFCSTKVVVCLEERWRLVDVSLTLERMGYKIIQASVKYPSPYGFLKGIINKSEDIDVKTLGKDESENMIHQILDIAIQCGCFEDNGQLIVSGPSQELHDDLMTSFRMNDLVVSGGQVCRDGWEFDTELLAFPVQFFEFFVTPKDNSSATRVR